MRGAVDGGNIWWVAPNFTIASIIWRHLKRATRHAWVDKSEQEHRIELPGGGSVTVRSADNEDSLRGDGLDGLVGDELAFMSQAAWIEALRPALADKKGWFLGITTPNGFNWVKNMFDTARDRAGWERWQMPSSVNPLMTPAELEQLTLELGRRAYAQEILAQFMEVEGAEWGSECFGDGIWFKNWPDDSQIEFRAMSCDPSKGKGTRGDYSAIIKAAVTLDRKIYVEADLQRRDATQIARDAIRQAIDFRTQVLRVEDDSSGAMSALFRTAVQEQGGFVPVIGKQSRGEKIARITMGLGLFLKRGDVFFKSNSPGTSLLVEQLRAFPVADFDDGPDALDMAFQELRDIAFGVHVQQDAHMSPIGESGW
jgi:predicted phage terminase large subunit-like protein